MQDEEWMPPAALRVAGAPPYDVSVPGCAGVSAFCCIAGCVDDCAPCGAPWERAIPATANRQAAPAANISREFISAPWFMRKARETFSGSLLVFAFRSPKWPFSVDASRSDERIQSRLQARSVPKAELVR